MSRAMAADFSPNPLPLYFQRTQAQCPRCERADIEVLPANNPGSDQEWFRCGACDHMWSQRRDRTEQGDGADE